MPSISRVNRRKRLPITRRGVASVLAMMFLIIFGSLVAAMAVASTGNVRTAATHLHVLRAMSAAETGMEIAVSRLDLAANRFVISRSELDQTLAKAVWEGDSATIGTHVVIPPIDAFIEAGTPAGIAQALANRHDADLNIITQTGFISSSSISAAPADVSTTVYAADGWVYTPAVAIEAQPVGQMVPPPAYQVRYAPLADYSGIRIIVDGIVFDYSRGGRPIVRTIMRDYRLAKTVNHAIVSNSRILIGKNVNVEGDVANRFDAVNFNNADPVVMRSDFYGISGPLDAKLDSLFASLAASDLDGDNRLRIGHPVEGAGIPADADFDGDGTADGAFGDTTGDGFLDEFDVFVKHFDADNDNRVTLSPALTAGTAADGRTPELVDGGGDPLDLDLEILLDTAHADRNGNGVFGFVDNNGNAIFEPLVDTLLDFDPNTGTFPDADLGYRDGFIDVLDRYSKISGTLIFTAVESDWVNAQGDYSTRILGPINSGDQPPMIFEADATEMPPIDETSFSATENSIIAAADGTDFWQQVADQLGVALADLTFWTLAQNPAGAGQPYFNAVWPDADLDGRPDNYTTSYWETSPYNAPSYTDLFYRPHFRNMIFRNVRIPMGLNGLFEDCTFVGATMVNAYTINSHPHWNEYGTMDVGTDGYPEQRYPRMVYGDDAGTEPEWDAPSALPAFARPPSANVLMTTTATTPLDKGDVRISEEASLVGLTFADLPEPLIIGTERVVDTKAYSNNIRFHDSLFVGSIVSDTPQIYTQVRNKLQFTGATQFAQQHPVEPNNPNLNPDAADVSELIKSSMMLPNYSVDLGSFNSPPDQRVNMTGAIVAGVLDARGNTQITGTLLLTFSPQLGTAPMVDAFGVPVGNPAGFNASLGYFGDDAGDMESLDPAVLPLLGGVPIVGWDVNLDGLVDLPYTEPQPPGSVAVPFNGYGRIQIRHDPNMILPDGLMLPLSAQPLTGTYQEGAL